MLQSVCSAVLPIARWQRIGQTYTQFNDQDVWPYSHRPGGEERETIVRVLPEIFGVIKVYDQNGWIQAQTPGARDIIVFDESAPRIGKPGGIAHFGFRLVNSTEIDVTVRAVKEAGGKILEKGEFCPGEPYLFFKDPDGYEVEIAFESPTPVDPKPKKK